MFEARNPSNPAVVSEIDGVVKFGSIKRGNRELYVVDEKTDQNRKYLIGLSKHLLVQEGDFVRAGMALSDGAISPGDILAIKGPFAVQSYRLQNTALPGLGGCPASWALPLQRSKGRRSALPGHRQWDSPPPSRPRSDCDGSARSSGT